MNRDSVRDSWDSAVDAYTQGQLTGRDHYRYDFFGPAHVERCGDVAGLQVLDVGCGSGYFAREMARRGASVTGVDISPRMIEHARRIESDDPLGITYLVADAAELHRVVPAGAFELATSCLALQDMPDVPAALRQIVRALVPGGRLVATISHPFNDTPYRRWEEDFAGGKRWLCIDGYFDRGPVEYRWKGWPEEFTTSSVHVTLEDWLRWFREGGLALNCLEEPRPTPEALARTPDLEDAARVPYYLLVDLRAPGG